MAVIDSIDSLIGKANLAEMFKQQRPLKNLERIVNVLQRGERPSGKGFGCRIA
jgi:hypothetical protein